MKAQNKQLSAKWPSLLLSAFVILAVGVRTFAQEKQNADLTSLSIDELMNIEVASTATLTDTKPRLVPAAMTTITAEQIKGSGARSLFELLDIYVPNLQWKRNLWEADNMGLRGIMNDRDDKYLLLVNGRNMNERTHYGALTERDQVLLNDIHHIDVVRGPGSALYGPGAVSMVINIVTFNAETFQGTEFTTRLGAIEEFYTAEVKHGQKSDDNDGGLFVYAGVGKYVGADQMRAPQIWAMDFPDNSGWFQPWNWGYLPPYPVFPSDSIESGEPMKDPALPRDGESARGLPPIKLHVELTKDNWDIWARYTRGGKYFGWVPQILARDPYGYSYLENHFMSTAQWAWPYVSGPWIPFGYNRYIYQQATGYIGYTQELSKDVDVDYAFSYEMLDYERSTAASGIDPPDYIQEAYREDNYYGKVMLKWQAGDQHKIAFGTEVSHSELGIQNVEWYTGNPVDQMVSNMPRWSTTMYSLMGEWQWNLNDKWTTFLGGRADHHTYTDLMFSPRAAIVHTPTEKDTYKLMWSRSVRATYEEEMKAQFDSDGSNSNPEKLDSVELRYERQQSKNLDLAASLFLHYNLEIISYSSYESGGHSIPVGTQKEWGAELEASYHTDKTRLTLSHGYTKLIDFQLSPDVTSTFITAHPNGYGNDLAAWANHITKLTAQHKLDDKWTLDGSLRIYWGFPGMKDLDNYTKATAPNSTLIEDGWKKAYRGNYYLDLGLQYQPSKDLTIGVYGYYLLGIFDRDLNKRNEGYGGYRDHAPAVSVSLTYKF
jgi:iron complex outermembrane receptor protein